MANVDSNLANWSTTASSNQPDSTDTATVRDDLQQIQATVRKYLRNIGSDIASASTVDLSTATGEYLTVTGTTNITAFGTVSSGIRFLVRFSGSLRLTHSAALLLPGATRIQTQAGDHALLESLGSGNWRCVAFYRASVMPVLNCPGDTIASASTVDLGTATGDYLTISGTTPITSFGTVNSGNRFTLYFSDALTITHNGTSLILPRGLDITTTAGDVAEFISLGSGNWRCLSYTKTNAIPSDNYAGTFTPVLADASSGGHEATAGTVGRYEKKGKTVIAWITLANIDTTGLTAGNQVFITGLPFTCITSGGHRMYSGTVGYGSVTVTTGLRGYVGSNTNYIAMQDGSSNMTVSQITSGTGDLYMTLTYEAAT